MDTPTRWSDAQLDAMRHTQDSVADPVVAALFAAGQVDAVNSLMKTLVENDGLPPGALPASVAAYLAATGGLPDWADPARIAAGERVFWRYGPAMIAILHCYALPFCYAGRKGVQVLALTARLTSNPTRRIIETAQMMVDVMRPGGLGSAGTGIRTAQKVRLMHAGVRCLIAQYPGWKPEFDLPINQEDLAGTLLSFSFITLDGLRRLGYVLSNDEIEGYLHAWKVVGHILGIHPELLPLDYADAEAFAARIAARQFAACEEGRYMTRALVEMLRHIVPGNVFDAVPELLMRYFLGDPTADLLAVAPGRAAQILLGPLQLLAHTTSTVTHSSNELARVHELFGRALIEGIVLVGRGGKRIPFSVPTELLQAWGVNWLP
jgi:ER-bound oxygenase mpaB/B'/Rubber oxygenase, catalytic domain